MRVNRFRHAGIIERLVHSCCAGAAGGIRTRTSSRTQRPQRCAATVTPRPHTKQIRTDDGAHGEIRTLTGSLPTRPERAAATVTPHAHHRPSDPIASWCGRQASNPHRLSASELKSDASPSSATPASGRDRLSIDAESAGSLVVVPAEGIEPSRPLGQPGLNRPRLPVPPRGLTTSRLLGGRWSGR
jgi:hypothetical protein